ncbi:GGDEF domain-containing protein [Streptomyces sp. TRM 70351]|uniref:GGDEF domain-containing protein n=1 Tax=Streptomyces sp. TRM 70351 TaxID=3116552 RepID=UPI002E7AD446|nr:GGDEF domain-containing protein [Streptomyces sp. TRM 70351]MEE1929840.1 GGDEF domain-containing protein [Streptomyces sp. TRM 70351]
MSAATLLPAAVAAAPFAAGWGVHGLCLRRQLRAARRDPLTGLRTRAAFERAATRALRRGPHAVLVIDLDGFKAVNDTHGHAAGDHALTAAAGALTETLEDDGRGGIVARLGGDEFAAVVPAPHAYAVPWLLRGLHDHLCAPLAYKGHTLHLGASIGACLTAELDVPVLPVALRLADEAMYAAKRDGGGWRIASGSAPACRTVNGRRAGRRGTRGVAG